MEVASFVASYVLSVLTLIGLIVAIVFYFQQNKILNNKSKIDTTFQLYAFLDKNEYFTEYISFLKDVSPSPNQDWKQLGPMCHKSEIIAKMFYKQSLDIDFFNSQYKHCLLMIGDWVYSKSLTVNYYGKENNQIKKFCPNFYRYWLENHHEIEK